VGFFKLNEKEKRRLEVFFQEKATERIRESEKKFEAILESSSDGIVMLDEDNTIIKVNKKFLKLSGFSKSFFIGRKADVLGSILGVKDVRKLLKSAGKKHDLPLNLTNKKGRVIDAELNVYAIRHLNKIVGRALIIKDVSLENKLRKMSIEREKEAALNRLKERFLMRISHELRHPLTPIIGYSELALKKLSGDLKEYVEKILLNAMQLRDLINNLLMITMLESGELQVKLRNVNVTRMLDDLLLAYKTELKLKGVKLIKDYKSSPVIMTDPVLLEKVLNSLINNAVSFTKKGYVKVSVKERKDKAVIDIIDTGVGISKDLLKKVAAGFSYLYLKEDFSRKYRGFAVSLLIDNLIIRKLNGSLDIKSRKWKGTKVRIIL